MNKRFRRRYILAMGSGLLMILAQLAGLLWPAAHTVANYISLGGLVVLAGTLLFMLSDRRAKMIPKEDEVTRKQ